MSTVIDNGFRLATTDLSAAWSQLRDFQPRVRSEAESLLSQWLANRAVEVLDQVALDDLFHPHWSAHGEGWHHMDKETRSELESRACALLAEFGGNAFATAATSELTRMLWSASFAYNIPGESSALSVARQELEHRWKETRRGHRHTPEIDFGFTITLFPVEDQILGMYRGNSKLAELWLKQPGVEAYGYWNNTDSRPKGVSSAEWDQRRQDWDRAVGHNLILESGLTLTMVDPDRLPAPKPEALLNHVPSFRRRVHARAKRRLLNQRTKELLELEEGASQSTQDMVHAYMDAVDWLETEEGKRALVLSQSEVEGRLLRTVTKEALLQPLPPLEPKAFVPRMSHSQPSL